MNIGSGERNRAARISIRPRVGERAPTPPSAQVQSIEMRNLPVSAIAHDCRLEQRLWLPFAEPGKKPLEPILKLARVQHSSHALRFHKSRRQKVIAARFPCLTVDVIADPAARLVNEEFAQSFVA